VLLAIRAPRNFLEPNPESYGAQNFGFGFALVSYSGILAGNSKILALSGFPPRFVRRVPLYLGLCAVWIARSSGQARLVPFTPLAFWVRSSFCFPRLRGRGYRLKQFVALWTA
jgi:hypothetical protein